MSAPDPAPAVLATGRGKLILLLLCTIAFVDFIDGSIVNVALPAIRADLGFSVQDLQWVPSGYLLTYGGLMLLGGRAADLLGRRRVLVAGTLLFAASCLAGGLAGTPGVLVGARLAQGAGAAMMLPAALSILTTTFRDGAERAKALGVWGGVAGLASAVGVLAGGLLTEGPGWRWVMLVNLPFVAAALAGVLLLLPADRPARDGRGFDAPGAALVTGGMLLLVFTLVKAPDAGWDAARTVGGLAGAAVLLALFLLVEARTRAPMLPLSILRVRGLAAADATLLVTAAGMLSMFFFLSLYMVNVLHYSPLETGSAYLPLTLGVGISAGAASKLMTRTGTRPVLVAGLLVSAAGLYLLSRIPVDGSYPGDLLPGLLVASLGLGAVFVSVTAAANAGVPAERAGLAAALLNASQQIGGALGLAIFSALAASRTTGLLHDRRPVPDALTGGFQRALLAGCLFLVAAAAIALRAGNARGEAATETPAPVPERV
ncbi:MFS transporter [Actinomadura parmotrematis]|uniref:MFS transporter n=1 Tax=Actinomadura parmotrematis TaxID=2864039 RepID=A0ABS7G4T9_9ACTN|nr:MFS transporter [Actinomadura parmotrematis]MBW8486864.1 MFS transporter [Actinomadura parmotrematis]